MTENRALISASVMEADGSSMMRSRAFPRSALARATSWRSLVLSVPTTRPGESFGAIVCEKLLHPLALRRMIDAAERPGDLVAEEDVLLDGQRRHQGRLLVETGYPDLRGLERARGLDRTSLDEDLAGVARDGAGEDLDQASTCRPRSRRAARGPHRARPRTRPPPAPGRPGSSSTGCGLPAEATRRPAWLGATSPASWRRCPWSP